MRRGLLERHGTELVAEAESNGIDRDNVRGGHDTTEESSPGTARGRGYTQQAGPAGQRPKERGVWG
jgi:hypothetical protein